MTKASTKTPAKVLGKVLGKVLDQALAELAEQGIVPVRLVIALSGGADSTALLHTVNQHLGQHFSILALHADHGLHPQSGQWSAFCRQLCQRLQVPLQSQAVAVSSAGNLEAAARQARYDFFLRHINSDDLLLFGHHLQDQMETVLLRLLQGRGLLGMRRHGSLGQGYFLRPFLSTDKTQLVEYLLAVGESWIDDPSNRQTSFDRNYLRHEVVPLVSGRWPNAAQALERISADAAAQSALLQRYVLALPDPVPLSQVPQPPGQARVWLRAFLASRGHHRVTDRSIDEFLRQSEAGGRAFMALGSTAIEVPASIHAWRNDLYYEAAAQAPEYPGFESDTTLPWRLRWRRQILAVDADAAQTPGAVGYRGQLRIVTRDQLPDTGISRIHRLNQRLKKYFQQGQIPPWRRSDYPLVFDAHGLVCVPGIWLRDTSVLGGDLSGYCSIRWASSDAGVR